MLCLLLLLSRLGVAVRSDMGSFSGEMRCVRRAKFHEGFISDISFEHMSEGVMRLLYIVRASPVPCPLVRARASIVLPNRERAIRRSVHDDSDVTSGRRRCWSIYIYPRMAGNGMQRMQPRAARHPNHRNSHSLYCSACILWELVYAKAMQMALKRSKCSPNADRVSVFLTSACTVTNATLYNALQPM